MTPEPLNRLNSILLYPPCRIVKLESQSLCMLFSSTFPQDFIETVSTSAANLSKRHQLTIVPDQHPDIGLPPRRIGSALTALPCSSFHFFLYSSLSVRSEKVQPTTQLFSLFSPSMSKATPALCLSRYVHLNITHPWQLLRWS